MKIFIQTIKSMTARDILKWVKSCFSKRKKAEPSLIALNIDWFTNCNWREQIAAFGQLSNYYHNKL